jgi:hypothetical protein
MTHGEHGVVAPRMGGNRRQAHAVRPYVAARTGDESEAGARGAPLRRPTHGGVD